IIFSARHHKKTKSPIVISPTITMVTCDLDPSKIRSGRTESTKRPKILNNSQIYRPSHFKL
ncbi:hypothetical protein ACJBU7_11415, partial [Streptococcus suis]